MYGNGPPSCIVTYRFASQDKQRNRREEKERNDEEEMVRTGSVLYVWREGGGKETTNCVGRFESTDHCFETETNGRAQWIAHVHILLLL